MTERDNSSKPHLEIELRLRVEEPARLIERLTSEGALPIGQGTVTTMSFDFPDRRLRAARQTLRLREDWTGLTLTGKIPLSSEEHEDSGGAKVRDEINVSCAPESLAELRRLLASIGLIETLSYAKVRQSWALGSTRIDVDRLLDGGRTFVEIEGEPDEIAEVRARLGLADARVETRSYFEIVQLARQ